MSILYEPQDRVFTIHTKRSTWQMKVSRYGHLLHVYYGSKIEHMDLSFLVRGINRGFSGTPYDACDDRGYSLDTLPQEYPCSGTGDYRTGCLHAIHADGSQAVELLYVSHRIYAGKYRLPGLPSVRASDTEAQTLEILLKDRATGLEVILYYGVLEENDVITRALSVRNGGQTRILLSRVLSCCVDFPGRDMDMLSFHGRHAMERILQRSRVPYGRLSVGSVRGTSSHQENPFVILCDRDAGEEQGRCYSMSFVYSGNFLAEAEADQIDQTRFVMGIHPDGFCWTLEAGEEFIAPEVILSYSGAGFGLLSVNLHDLYRQHILPQAFQGRRRPVLLNSWEAVEFDFTEETLLSMAESAANLGIELFVLDDGWFGSRDCDKSGLGDWFPNLKKLPSGLSGLSDRIRDMGMEFGIWIEPEMVNEDSELFRAHPDWCLRIPGRKPNLERCQLVLDLGRKEVREHLFDCISRVMDESKAAYIKWDMNRSLSDIWSACLPGSRQGEASHRYILGVYELMERLTQKYPHVLWEGCSGGGGRFDAGILSYMPQIWCSDNTDAVERIHIQYGTSFGYPACAVGSHVSASPNQQTGRETPLQTRADVALAGCFGYELDVRMLSGEEKAQIRRQIEDYWKLWHVIQQGDYYRLSNPQENADFAAWEFVAKDQKEAVVNVVILHAKANPPFLCIRARGLKEDARYRIDGGEAVYTGNALMHAGIPIPVTQGDYQSIRYHIQQV